MTPVIALLKPDEPALKMGGARTPTQSLSLSLLSVEFSTVVVSVTVTTSASYFALHDCPEALNHRADIQH